MKKVLLNLPMERQIEEIPFHEWEYMKNISLEALDHRLFAIVQEGSAVSMAYFDSRDRRDPHLTPR